MKALSVRQPWAYAILYLGKDVENRDWPTTVSERVAVHASKTVDTYAIDDLREEGYEIPDDLPTGAFVGEVDVNGSRHARDVKSPWAGGPFCHLLSNPTPYETPIPGKGQLGYFEWDKP